MRENLNRSRGVVFSGTVLLELAKNGVSREQAYEWVQRNAMRSFAEQRDFKTLLLADPDVTGVLPAAEIERAFDLDEQLKHVDYIFDRVFQPSRGGGPKVPHARACFRHVEAVGVRPAGPDDRRRAAIARLSERRGRAARQVLRAGSRDDRARAGASSWPPTSPTRCSPTR